MNTSRAPRGIPTGGQFTANVLSEPTISLGAPPARSSFERGHRDSQPPFLRGPQKIDGEWVPEQSVESDPATGTLGRRESSEELPPHLDPTKRWAAGKGWVDIPPLSPRSFGDRVNDAVLDATDKIAESKAGELIENALDAADPVMDRLMFGRDTSEETPAPEAEGSFVGWGQMVPKFLRRK